MVIQSLFSVEENLLLSYTTPTWRRPASQCSILYAVEICLLLASVIRPSVEMLNNFNMFQVS